MKKKAIKIATSTAIAASAFVAAAPTQAATNVDAQVKAAVDAGTVLKWAISIEGTGDGQTRPWDAYNDAKAKLAKAEAAVAGLSAADKAVATAKLEATKLQISRAQAYIDAITAGEKITTARLALETAIASGNLNAVETAYHGMTAEARKQNKLLDRVYGQSTRDLIRTNYKVAAEKVQASVLYDVTVKMALDKAEAFVTAGDYVKAEAYLTEANNFLSQVSTTFKTVLTNKTAAVAATVTPMVTSVTAINAKKIEVKFNKEVSETQAETLANYTLVGVTGFGTPTLQADGKTVVLTSATAIPNGTTFVVTVDGIATKADANVKTSKYTQTLTFSDTVRPSLSNVTYPRPGVAELNFSEELSTAGNVTVYDGLVESTTVTKSLSGGKLTLGALALNKEYRVVITGAADQSGNLIAAPIQVTVKSDVSDTVKPVVSSISSQGIDTVKVQFSEAIQQVGGVYASIDVNGSSATGTLSQTFDAKTNTLTVSGIAGIASGTVKSITVKGFTDLANNAGNAVTKVIAFSTAAPALQSTQVVKEGTKTFAVLTFDKAVAAIDSTFAASYVTFDSIYKTTTLPATVDTDKKQVKLEVTGQEAGAYTVNFAAGKLSDGVTSNSNTVQVKFNVGTSTDTSVPEVATVFLPGDTLPSGSTVEAGAVYVKYDKPMAASALNADNYTVDGSTVFTNPIFVGDKTLVKLTIKDSVITVSGARNFAISTAVKGENNVALKYYAAVKSFNENVKPVLTSASLVDDMTIELSFSELLGTTGFSTATNDFEVHVGGTKNVITAVTDGTVGDNKVRVTLTNRVTADQLLNSAITVKTLSTADITDKAGNTLTANTTLTVAK